MKFAATPIRITDRMSPNTNTQGCSRAAPATARTLSRLMLTSAKATPHAALAKLFAGFSPECSSPTTSSEPALSSLCRISRYIRHATHSRRIPPASTRPTICSSWVTSKAKAMRSTSAASTPIMMTLRRCAAGSPAASAPTTIALSPARTMSMNRISRNAANALALIMSIAQGLAEAEHAPQAQHMLAADPALVDHVASDPQDDGQANVIEPGIALDQAGDVIRRQTHEQHREGQP